MTVGAFYVFMLMLDGALSFAATWLLCWGLEQRAKRRKAEEALAEAESFCGVQRAIMADMMGEIEQANRRSLAATAFPKVAGWGSDRGQA